MTEPRPLNSISAICDLHGRSYYYDDAPFVGVLNKRGFYDWYLWDEGNNEYILAESTPTNEAPVRFLYANEK